MHKDGGPVLHRSTCTNYLECINCVVIGGAAISFLGGKGGGGGVEATDYRQNEPPITNKYILPLLLRSAEALTLH